MKKTFITFLTNLQREASCSILPDYPWYHLCKSDTKDQSHWWGPCKEQRKLVLVPLLFAHRQINVPINFFPCWWHELIFESRRYIFVLLFKHNPRKKNCIYSDPISMRTRAFVPYVIWTRYSSIVLERTWNTLVIILA